MTLGRKISEELKKYRSRTGASQAQLAKDLKISRATLNRWEGHGADAATLTELERIAAALKTTPADLLGGVTPPPAVEVLQRELRAAQDEILRLKVELAEAAAIPQKWAEVLQGLPTEGPHADHFLAELKALAKDLRAQAAESRPGESRARREGEKS